MIARPPIRVSGVLTDATLRRKPCDCTKQAHDMVRVGQWVHATCRNCHKDVDWPVTITEHRRARFLAHLRWFLRWLGCGFVVTAVVVLLIAS